MDVIYHNRKAAQVDFSAQLVSKEDLLKRCDILSLHATHAADPRRFGRSELEQMKPSAVLINTARSDG